MEVPCVRVAREDGEATRRALAEADLIDDGHEIVVEDGRLYVPVRDADAVRDLGDTSDVDGAPDVDDPSDSDTALDRDALPDALEVITREVPERETQTTPADLLGFDPSYERLGDVALIDEDDPDRARELARAIVDSDLPVETVLNKASKVKGETRVRDWELLAGETTEVVHREYGCEFALDLADVYFSPRLATERHRVAQKVAADERAFDMFAGVGPFVIPFAKRGADCVGVDVNERAIEYLEENARRNGVDDRVTAIADDVRAVAPDYAGWADRVVMNLPHSADDFLEAAVQLAGDDCVVHYYDIQHEDDPFGPGERAIREAADPDYEVTVENRRTVRSYAPHELNVCLDVRLERLDG